MGKQTQLLAKYISAYAPYGLKLIDTRDNHKFELMALYDDSFSVYSESESTRTVYFNNNTYFDIKLTLKLLGDCTPDELKLIIKHLFRDTQMIRPDLNTIECNKGFITFFDNSTLQRYTAVKPGGNNLPVLNMSNHFDDYEIFFKLHIDMYGLIDAGLAVDINTLQPC